jgi:hypothetical protein
MGYQLVKYGIQIVQIHPPEPSLGLLRHHNQQQQQDAHFPSSSLLEIVRSDPDDPQQRQRHDDATDADPADDKENSPKEDDHNDPGARHEGANGVGGVVNVEGLDKNQGGIAKLDDHQEEEEQDSEPMQVPPSKEDGGDKTESEKSVKIRDEDHTVVAAVNPKGESKTMDYSAGAGDLAFVVDLVRPRQSTHVQKNETGLDASSSAKFQAVAQLAGIADPSALRACEYADVEPSTQGHSVPVLRWRSECLALSSTSSSLSSRRFFLYNPAPFPRYRCELEIPAGGIVQIAAGASGECNQPVRVFKVQPTFVGAGSGFPPIVVKAHNGLDPNPTLEAVHDCDVPCQIESGLPERGDRTVDGTDWKLTVNDADPFVDEKAKVELTAFKVDEYSSTSNLRSSDIPLSQYNFDLYDLRNRPAIKWQDADNAATYLLDTKCNPPYGLRRHKWYAALLASNFTTRSYGQCDHNTNLREGETTQTVEGRLALSRKNRIHLAFEAAGEKDYATPIVWESLLSGAVPAILGARNLQDILPHGSAILASSFNSWDSYAAYIKHVSENQTLWESYHAWRDDEDALRRFEAKFAFTRTSPECRTCRWAHSKLHGLGWDHQQQQTRETVIPRRLCVNVGGATTAPQQQLVVEPFREKWSDPSGDAAPAHGSKCLDSLVSVTSIIEHVGYKVKRTVSQHDGVIDMTIEAVEASTASAAASDLLLRIQVSVRNRDGAYFPNSHTLVPTSRGSSLVSSATIQDDKAKASVLASWPTEITSPSEGWIEVVVLKKGQRLHHDESRRIRIITEDVSEVHDKRTEYFPSTFAKQMTGDFVDSLEVYYTDS